MGFGQHVRRSLRLHGRGLIADALLLVGSCALVYGIAQLNLPAAWMAGPASFA